MPLSSHCAGCKTHRDAELLRQENGGKLLPIVAEDANGKDYSGETRDPCQCGSRRMVIRLRF